MTNEFRGLVEKLEKINIVEAKGHLDHPEDLVFLEGSKGASRALSTILSVAKKPKQVTIKWDGYPALIFGRNEYGKFSIMDKHMFNKADGTGRNVFSPKQFAQYDVNRGVVRSDLSVLISQIWNGLSEDTPLEPGYYWGDLLFSNPLQEQNGMYTFRANPNGITYTVEADSEVGQLFKGKQAAIAVHQTIPANAPSTDYAKSLNGTIGHLKNSSNVAIVKSAMPVPPKVQYDQALIDSANTSIANYSAMADDVLNNAPQARNAFVGLFTVYINKRIVSGNLNGMGTDFLKFVSERPLTEAMKKKLIDYITIKKEEIKAMFQIWVDLYKLKTSIVTQLQAQSETGPIKGYLSDKTQSQEGFVFNGLKFIDRMGFSRQNLSGQA
jgi:hypothetical protein